MRLQQEDELIYEVPKKYGRVAMIQSEVPSNETNRNPYLSTNYKIDDKQRLELVKCAKDSHLANIPEEKRDENYSFIQNAYCLDISDAYLSGGTNAAKDLKEGKLVLMYERCEEFASFPDFECATPSEYKKFVDQFSWKLSIVDTYIDFNEKDT